MVSNTFGNKIIIAKIINIVNKVFIVKPPVYLSSVSPIQATAAMKIVKSIPAIKPAPKPIVNI